MGVTIFVQGNRGLNDAEFERHVANLQALREESGDQNKATALAAADRLGAVLASHDDTTTDHVNTSAARNVAFAEFPTTEEAAEACRECGISVVIGAPNLIRGGSHSGNVSAGDLAREGLIDILSSDYVPAALINGAFLLADIWNDLPRAISTVTSAPAKVAKLIDRGRIEEGLRADLVRVSKLGSTPIVRGVWSSGVQVG